MMKLALIGYGRMGHLLESMAEQYGFTVSARIDPALGVELSQDALGGADVAIEFTTPATAAENLQQCLSWGIPVVCGTTGWFEQLPAITALAEENQTGLIYGSNFSVGMNLFFDIVRQAAELMHSVDDYDPYGLEMHHNRKKDSPSGTARVLTDIMLQHSRKSVAQFDRLERRPKAEEFHFASVRAGDIPGTHIIGFDSVADSIELKHTARNRAGFAKGALLAAKWLIGRSGVYEFTTLFKELMQ